MIKILFICHGNICRSACAQYVFQDMVDRAGLAGQFDIDSAATSTEELGNPVYPPMKKVLDAHGIRCAGHSAKQMTKRDYDKYDMLIASDEENLYYMRRICKGDPEGKFLSPYGLYGEAGNRDLGSLVYAGFRTGLPGCGEGMYRPAEETEACVDM